MTRKKHEVKSFEGIGRRFKASNGLEYADTSANIYMSMLLAPAYLDLNNRQRQLYLVMKAQYFGKRKPRQDYKEESLFDSDEYFYMNFAAVQGYGLYTKNMQKEFAADKQALCDHGFIELVSSGAKTHKKSIYKYSDKWQQWQQAV